MVTMCLVHSEFENWLMADFPINQSIPNWKVGDYNEICILQGPTLYISLTFDMKMYVLPPFYV